MTAACRAVQTDIADALADRTFADPAELDTTTSWLDEDPTDRDEERR